MSMMKHNTVGAHCAHPQNITDNHHKPVKMSDPSRPQNAGDTKHVQNALSYAEIPKGSALLLHSCCGPCSIAVIAALGTHFTLYISFYNPNILPLEEYQRRLDAQKTVLANAKTAYPITFFEGAYTPEIFLEAAAGLEQQPEGGKRCTSCFHLRLAHSATLAKANDIPYFATTLSISPHKNVNTINQIGARLAKQHKLHFLAADFKKNGGFQESVRLSKQLGIYRQNYCGCGF